MDGKVYAVRADGTKKFEFATAEGVQAAPAIAPALFDPAVGIDFARMVHGGQQFDWRRLVVAGDELTTVCSFASHEVKGAMTFFTFVTTTTDASSEVVCEGRWTNIVRGAA